MPNMKKFIVGIVLVVIAAGIGVLFWLRQAGEAPSPAPSPSPSPEPTADTTEAISQSLEAINLPDLEQEFQQIDQELNTL